MFHFANLISGLLAMTSLTTAKPVAAAAKPFGYRIPKSSPDDIYIGAITENNGTELKYLGPIKTTGGIDASHLGRAGPVYCSSTHTPSKKGSAAAFRMAKFCGDGYRFTKCYVTYNSGSVTAFIYNYGDYGICHKNDTDAFYADVIRATRLLQQEGTLLRIGEWRMDTQMLILASVKENWFLLLRRELGSSLAEGLWCGGMDNDRKELFVLPWRF